MSPPSDLSSDLKISNERNGSYNNDFKLNNASFELFLKTMLLPLLLLPGVWI